MLVLNLREKNDNFECIKHSQFCIRVQGSSPLHIKHFEGKKKTNKQQKKQKTRVDKILIFNFSKFQPNQYSWFYMTLYM